MSDLHEKLGEVFDATDANAASDVAHAALSLMRYALMAAETQDSGMKIGRDLATELSAHSMHLAQKLRLLSWHNLAPEREAFIADLLGREIPLPSPPNSLNQLEGKEGK